MDTITDCPDLVPATPGVRRASDELRPIGPARDPLPPVAMGAAHGGGGTPNRDVAVGHGDQIPPASQIPDCSTEQCSTTASLASLLPATVDRPYSGPLKQAVRWDGSPTMEALRRISEEARTPSFDVDVAVLLLESVGEGLTLTRACQAVGVKRAVVSAWKRLVPEFAALLDMVETDLGAFWRDRAAEEAHGGDPALVSARLKVAASFNRKIATGEDSGGSVVNVQVNW